MQNALFSEEKPIKTPSYESRCLLEENETFIQNCDINCALFCISFGYMEMKWCVAIKRDQFDYFASGSDSRMRYIGNMGHVECHFEDCILMIDCLTYMQRYDKETSSRAFDVTTIAFWVFAVTSIILHKTMDIETYTYATYLEFSFSIRQCHHLFPWPIDRLYSLCLLPFFKSKKGVFYSWMHM